MSQSEKKRGGARPGAGRKPLDEESETVRRCFTLTEKQFRYLQEIGQGNASRGLRHLIRSFNRKFGY